MWIGESRRTGKMLCITYPTAGGASEWIVWLSVGSISAPFSVSVSTFNPVFQLLKKRTRSHIQVGVVKVLLDLSLVGLLVITVSALLDDPLLLVDKLQTNMVSTGGT